MTSCKSTKIAIEDLTKDFKIEYFDERYFALYQIKKYEESFDITNTINLSKSIYEYEVNLSNESGILYNLNNDLTNLINEPLENTYLFSEVINPNKLENIPKENYDKLIRKMPSGNYLRVIFNRENLNDTIKKISEFINKNNLKINELIELTLFDNIFAYEENNCEFQILLK